LVFLTKKFASYIFSILAGHLRILRLLVG